MISTVGSTRSRGLTSLGATIQLRISVWWVRWFVWQIDNRIWSIWLGLVGTSTKTSISLPSFVLLSSLLRSGISAEWPTVLFLKWSWWHLTNRLSSSLTRYETGPVTSSIVADTHLGPVPNLWHIPSLPLRKLCFYLSHDHSSDGTVVALPVDTNWVSRYPVLFCYVCLAVTLLVSHLWYFVELFDKPSISLPIVFLLYLPSPF